jgi:AAHS family 4-hydroxybenzoate transporter-like MFS transporter
MDMSVTDRSVRPESDGISAFQIRALVFCGLVGLLDGNDTGIMSIGIPGLASVLHLPPSALGWAVSGSFLGAAIGALAFGSLGDRFGRKRMLVAAVILFGVFTVLTPLAGSLNQLVFLRIMAGIGLGGATPCFITLASEYSPARLRGTIVSLIWASFPLGLLLGGLFSGLVLTRYSWKVIFYIGGALPLLFAVAMMLALPESLDFLIARADRRDEARHIMAQLGYDARAEQAMLEHARTAAKPATVGPATLMRDGRLRATVCLWVILFAAFGTTACMAWVPTILHQHGVTLASAAVASSFLGVGALLGMIIAGRLVDRFGAVRALTGPLLIGAGATAMLGYSTASSVAASVAVGLVGAFVGLGASGAIALVALTYPSATRSTGAGWAMGMARLGQVIMPGLFAVLMGMQWSAEMIFPLLAICSVVAAVAAVLIGRNPQGSSAERNRTLAGSGLSGQSELQQSKMALRNP